MRRATHLLTAQRLLVLKSADNVICLMMDVGTQVRLPQENPHARRAPDPHRPRSHRHLGNLVATVAIIWHFRHWPQACFQNDCFLSRNRHGHFLSALQSQHVLRSWQRNRSFAGSDNVLVTLVTLHLRQPCRVFVLEVCASQSHRGKQRSAQR